MRITDLTLATLPAPDTRRWVSSRKQAVVLAVRTGLITMTEACERYSLSVEEFLSWDALFSRGGRKALRVTKLQDFREGAT
ncbi:CtrA inhibitor SciP [Azospirillum sp. sgz301742]